MDKVDKVDKAGLQKQLEEMQAQATTLYNAYQQSIGAANAISHMIQIIEKEEGGKRNGNKKKA